MSKLAWRLPLAVCAALALHCGARPPPPTEPAPLWAFYYGWYGTPAVSGRWIHWGDVGHDPDRLTDAGLPDIAASEHPEAGLYDSSDPSVIERQLGELSRADISGVVVSWWGKGSVEDAQLRALMDAIEASGSPVRVAPYFEQVREGNSALAVEDIGYLLETFGSRPSALRVDGRPAVFVYGRAIFPRVFCFFEQCPDEVVEADWSAIVSAVRQQGPAWLCADALGAGLFDRVPALAELGFDSVHVYNPHVEVDLGLDMAAGWRKLVRTAHARGLSAGATVLPGYDDTAIGRPGAHRLDRDGGRLYESLWAAAGAGRPDFYLLTSYNEWHEGSEIEPSLEHGDAYLELTRRLHRAAPPR
ncbi:MAG: hypothetical protein HYZ28_16190 [Myxococcales bacterium]|nr:hypothetical protein [Myxococcales bacterium]